MAAKWFELKVSRTDKDGKAPIRLVYQFEEKDGENVQRERKIIPTGLKIRPINWKQGQAVYLNRLEAKKQHPDKEYSLFLLENEVKALNSDLAAFKTVITNTELDFERKNKDYTLTDVVNAYHAQKTGLVADPKNSIADFIAGYVVANKGLIKHRTLLTYLTVEKHLRDYGKKHNEVLTFENLKRAKIKKFHLFLNDTGMNNTTVAKNISILKSLIKQALLEDTTIKAAQDFRDYTVTREDGSYEVIALEQHEFDAIMDLDLSDYSKTFPLTDKINLSYQSLDKVRDLFIFSCTTGLRYSDVADLKREHIRDNTIFKKAIKTGQQLEVPLNPISDFILKKYEGNVKPLPELSNQKANEYLKHLAKMAGITQTIEKTRKFGSEDKSEIFKKWQLVSFHTGRKTFSSLTLEKGAASHEVMSLTGHKKFATFQRYMNITKGQKRKAMSVWGEIEQPVKKLKAI